MPTLTRFLIGALITLGVVSIAAEEQINQDVYWKIRQEGTANSQILQTLHVLTDLYGPRLTGSPNLKAAGEWAVAEMQRWGLTGGHLEPWDFGHPGWVNERLSVHLISPVKDALVVEALAWTPGTSGVVRGQAVQITLPDRPMRDDLAKHLGTLKDAVKGRIVLVGVPRRVPVTFNAPPLRRDDADIIGQLNAPPAGRVGGPAAVPAAAPAGAPPSTPRPMPLNGNQIDEQLNQFLVESGALVRVNDAARDQGQIRAFQNRTYDPSKAPATVVMRNEDYGRISRLLADGREVQLEFDVVNRIYPEGRTNYNVISDIRGSDRADEVVMLGGHLDSWHAATGATDNAIGCAVTMEAARILAALHVAPRRTIRVALWSGEEQGLLGSQAYVKEHYGTFETPKADYQKFAGYFNIDAGTGRARGMTVFGPEAAAAILRDATASFKDLGVLGANTTRSRQRGNSDHTSFNEAGLPGILVFQDPIQYNASSWHSNLDTYERIVEDDVKKSAIVIAAAAYHLAMRDEPLPRFPSDQMPQRPPAAQPQTQTAATPPAPGSPAAGMSR